MNRRIDLLPRSEEDWKFGVGVGIGFEPGTREVPGSVDVNKAICIV